MNFLEWTGCWLFIQNVDFGTINTPVRVTIRRKSNFLIFCCSFTFSAPDVDLLGNREAHLGQDQ